MLLLSADTRCTCKVIITAKVGCYRLPPVAHVLTTIFSSREPKPVKCFKFFMIVSLLNEIKLQKRKT